MAEAMVHAGGFNVLLNGAALPLRTLGCIRTVRVEQEINVPAAFSLNFVLAGITETAQGAMLDTFAPGDDITILMGPDQLTTMIVGQVTAIEPRFGTFSSATIRGFDRMYRLRFGEKTRAFKELADGAIAEEVAHGAGVNIRVEGKAAEPNGYVKQQQESDYDFLIRRASEIDYELLVDGTTLVFRPSAEGAGPVRTLQFPRDVSQIDLDLRVPTAGATVIAHGFDPETNEPIQAESQGPTRRDRMGGTTVGYEVAPNFPSSAVTLARPDVTSVEALQVIADARYQAELADFIKGTATLAGDPVLIAGVNIQLAGLSARFDGIYYITAANHGYDDDTGYQTELTLRRTGV